MNALLRFVCFVIVTFVTSTSAYAQPLEPAPQVDELAAARQVGWRAALMIVERIEAVKAPGFPGIDAWVADFRKQSQGLDPQAEPEKWPKIDVDTLATHNPRFWRAFYEMAPGDPGVVFLYAGMLVGCGELTRAKTVIELEQFRPGVPEATRDSLGKLWQVADLGGKKSAALVDEGVKLFDQGDYAAAHKKYDDALKIWPQNPRAHYELGFTIRTQDLIAQGEKPELPEPGKLKAEINHKVRFSPEATASFARCRQHSPLMYEAYQGDDQHVLQAFQVLLRQVYPALKVLSEKQTPEVTDQAIEAWAKGCEDAELDDLALAGRQILVARRGHYIATDHPRIVTSLRRLVPGPDTETALEKLAGKTMAAYQIMEIENDTLQRAAESPASETPKPSVSEAKNIAAQPQTSLIKLGPPQLVREKGAENSFSAVVPIEVPQGQHLDKPQPTLAYIVFDDKLKAPPSDLKMVGHNFAFDFSKDKKTQDVHCKMQSTQQGATGEAHVVMVPLQGKLLDGNGVLRVKLPDLPEDKDIGLFILAWKLEAPASNVLVFKKKDFVEANGDELFNAAAAKVPTGTLEPAEAGK